ncbi:MAG: sulfite exporter TauE/SafE family protein [Candidatus Saganbacteria bacterium]|nr:sulfite exporter TauE/SafE family protein [Candidatus Saganbacteria bacterium]
MYYLGLVATGLIAGIMGGMLGIGGGSIVVPILVLGYGLSQHMSQGTTLAMMVPPIGLLAAWHYWKNGNVNITIAALLCLGFIIGGLAGAWIAHQIPDLQLKKIFGVFLLLIALKLIFWS